VDLKNVPIDAIAKTRNMQASNTGDELHLRIIYLESGKVYHYCQFVPREFNIPIVTCRHFGYAFGEMIKVRKLTEDPYKHFHGVKNLNSHSK
jgi:hypothetical protein